ncbi:MAG: chromosomal replication initiator protein DnaA [Porticoccaceae bacterium]|nr:chromosomal replication initiator protein DnaA [Porticoccaceae bacterium]
MSTLLWERCSNALQDELPEQQFNTWIRPLRSQEGNGELRLLAPNKFVSDWVTEKFLSRIRTILGEASNEPPRVIIDLQDSNAEVPALSFGRALDLGSQKENTQSSESKTNQNHSDASKVHSLMGTSRSNLDNQFTFQSFVEGKSNQLALAAAKQVAENPGEGYNPLFIYGGVGLGKTHLMQAVGNELKRKNPNARVLYLHSERFVADMVKALQLNAINDFKRFYRSADALLIDDIQFFANKDRSQEEFFHTFNSLLESRQQMIMSCDRYPKEIDGLEERLKSRFGWGLTVSVEPPELETRVAILMNKAQQANMDLPSDAAFFIAQRIRSNVRELEGALKRVMASAHFTGEPVTLDLIKESLKDLLAMQDRLVTVENIQRTVAEYYQIKLSDLMSKKRTRSLARPRQVAMALSKSLTNNSLPEIGTAFGGRDHTTVLHACRKIKELEESSADMREDLKNLNRTLSH